MMEGWKETEIGFMPIDWDVDRIDKFFLIQQGKQVSKKNRIGDNQRPFLRTSNLLWGKVIFDKLDYLHFTAEEEKKFKLEYNDLLVCEGGDIGRTAIWRNELGGCFYQNHLHRLRAKIKDIDPVFVLNWMKYAFLYGRVYFGRANITTIPNLSKSRLAEFLIPRPPLPEQHKIAYVLSTVQKAIEQQDKLIKTTTELKKALMQKLFTEGLHGEKQKQTEIGPVPESWEVVEFGEMYNFTKKPRGLKIEKPIPFIPMELISFDNMKVQHCEVRDKVTSGTYVEEGDLLLAKITPSFENGKQGFVEIGKPFAFATTEVIPIKENKNISNKYYLFYYLLKDDIRSILTGKMEGSTGRQRLSKTVLANTLIPKPPINEQVEIAEIFKTLDKKVSVALSKKQTLSDLFKTLLHELMTGQRRVHEIDFENDKEELLMAAEPEMKYNE